MTKNTLKFLITTAVCSALMSCKTVPKVDNLDQQSTVTSVSTSDMKSYTSETDFTRRMIFNKQFKFNKLHKKIKEGMDSGVIYVSGYNEGAKILIEEMPVLMRLNNLKKYSCRLIDTLYKASTIAMDNRDHAYEAPEKSEFEGYVSLMRNSVRDLNCYGASSYDSGVVSEKSKTNLGKLELNFKKLEDQVKTHLHHKYVGTTKYRESISIFVAMESVSNNMKMAKNASTMEEVHRMFERSCKLIDSSLDIKISTLKGHFAADKSQYKVLGNVEKYMKSARPVMKCK